MKNRKIKNDIILLVCLLAVGLAGFFAVRLFAPHGAEAVVTVDGKEWGRYKLSADAEIEIETKHGTNTLVIKNGEADVTDASCPDSLCVHQHKISMGGQTIVCLPNKMVVSIEGAEDAVDIGG